MVAKRLVMHSVQVKSEPGPSLKLRDFASVSRSNIVFLFV